MRICKRGHEVPTGECRLCRNLRAKRYYQKECNRQQKYLEDKKDFLVPLELWVHEDDVEEVREFIKRLNEKRIKSL